MSISYGARRAKLIGSVTGAEPGDVAVLTTNGSLASGMLVYAQRALTNEVHTSVCSDWLRAAHPG